MISDQDFDPIVVQKCLRENSAEISSFLKDLHEWENETEGTSKYEQKLSAVKTEKPQKTTNPPSDAKVSKKPCTDYKLWDKFDAESECKKIDFGLDKKDEGALRQESFYLKEKGNVFVRNEKWKEAVECYTKAIDFYAKDPIYYANRALCYLKLKNFVKVESDCTKALKLDPQYVKALQRRASARTSLQKYTDAFNDLKLAISLEPRNKLLISEIERVQSLLRKCENQQASESDQDCFTWPSTEERIEIVQPIQKTIFSRSKKPLKTIRVELASNVALSRPVENSDRQQLHQTLQQSTENAESSAVTTTPLPSSLSPNDLNKTLPAPKSFYQFLIDWTSLKSQSSFQKCQYLLQIDVKSYPKLFQGCFDEYFSEIVNIFVDNCDRINTNILPYLKEFTKIDRFSLCLMFLSKQEKSNLKKLLEYCENNFANTAEEVQLIKKQFEIN